MGRVVAGVGIAAVRSTGGTAKKLRAMEKAVEDAIAAGADLADDEAAAVIAKRIRDIARR
jgi:hypothetical protein